MLDRQKVSAAVGHGEGQRVMKFVEQDGVAWLEA